MLDRQSRKEGTMAIEAERDPRIYVVDDDPMRAFERTLLPLVPLGRAHR
jgi:hypothetical protein